MKLATGFLILWLSLAGGLTQSDTSPDAEESYSDWGLQHIPGSFESVNSYFDSFLELLGGKNGVCQYKCCTERYQCPDLATSQRNPMAAAPISWISRYRKVWTWAFQQ
ncbi:Group XIIB secretory phospholipase A2-like protein [Manis javanica]|nr:Group XIIB secretory phospholipase A2-like protein [Manis javanica]